MKQKTSCKFFVQSRLGLERFDLIIIIGILSYSAILSYISLFKYDSYQQEYDLAIFNQAFWNTITGGGLLTNWIEGGSHFGVHFSPILLSLIPFYAIFPGPQTLLISQSILLSLGAIPIYLFGRDTLGKGIGCVMGFLYLIYPGVHGVNLYDFHEVAFLPFLLGMALWSFLTGRKNILLLFSFLSLLVKEDVSLIILMIGLLGLYRTRKKPRSERWQYFALTIGSIGILLTFFIVIRPMFTTPGSAIVSGFLPQYFDPISNLSQNNGNRISYLLMIFLPFIFIPLGSPSVMAISIPSFLEILLSPSPFYYSINYQYSALIIPILFMATITTLHRIKNSNGKFGKKMFIPIVCLIIISSIFCSSVYSPISRQISIIKEADMQTLENHSTYVNHILSILPEDASIATQYNLLPQVSKHKQVWINYYENADIILVDSELSNRAAEFIKDIPHINANFDLLSKEKGLYIFVNKKNSKLRSNLSISLQSS